jgi:hypothetical protein
MFPSILPNGYHSFLPMNETPSVIAALADIYKKRAKKAISINDYRKLP